MNSILRFQHILTPGGLESHKRLEIDGNGVIVAIEDEPGSRFDGWLALPGMPNAHSHCFQRGMIGLGEAAAGEDSFWSWRQAMYRLASAISPEELAKVAARAFADMLAAGFTSVAEFHYLHHLADGAPGTEMARAVAEGAQRAGIRLLVLPVFYQSAGFGEPPGPRQGRFVHGCLDDYLRLLEALDDLSLGIAPHSIRAVAPEAITELETGARSVLGEEFPRHIHIAEQRAEVAGCLDRYGVTPVELLHEHVGLDGRWSLVHATHATPGEIELIGRCGAVTVVCPLTEAYLGDGLLDAVSLAAEGGRIAIGSDSNVRIDAVEELRLLEYGQRLRFERRACLATADGLGRPLWSATARSGAAAMMMPVGELRTGAFADLVVLNESSRVLSALAGDEAMDALITGGDAREFADVYVGGRRRVSSGEHQEEGGISASFAAAMSRLRARL